MINSQPLFYVDDDIDDLELFFEAATSLGIETKLFERADKLLKTLLNPPPKPSVVFVDLNMPIISGFEIMKEIKGNDFLMGIPVVVFSTTDDHITLEKCKKLGADYYIKKPVTIEHLREALQYVNQINWKQHKISGGFKHIYK